MTSETIIIEPSYKPLVGWDGGEKIMVWVVHTCKSGIHTHEMQMKMEGDLQRSSHSTEHPRIGY